MRLPLKNADDPASIDMQAFERMADTFIEGGFRYFDTAYPLPLPCERDSRQGSGGKAPQERFV